MAARKKVAETPPVGRTRVRVAVEGASAPSYFAPGTEKENLKFVSSGGVVMDCALGGGYVLGRVVNIVGDKSSGKTLMAMEICANFAMKFPNGWIRYAESEAAFDQKYAEALGIPIDRITFNPNGKPLETVEDLYDDLTKQLDANKGRPGVYIVDSLDALSDEAEMEADFDKGSYGGAKPKAIGKLFRMTVGQIEEQEVLFIVISQIRDKLNVTFGETKTRSGGRALDFYATHIVWLAEVGKKKQTINGIERIVGVDVKARVKKNKVGLPFREAEYPILFGYGIDDLTSGVEWLLENKREPLLADLGLSKSGYKVRITNLRNKGGPEAADLREKLRTTIVREWDLVESSFLPKSRKY